MEISRINVDNDYINELQEVFSGVNFRRIEKTEGVYVTNPENTDFINDKRIFTETQVKRTLRSAFAPFVSLAVKKKLSYFSQDENKDNEKVYKFDSAQDLQREEKYAIQSLGHATVLIQVPGFNILTDPVFNSLNALLYPEKTESYPKIDKLPKIDLIVISHNHRDHVDESSLKKLLANFKSKNLPLPKVLVPKGDKELLEYFGFNQVEEMEWYEKATVTKGDKWKINIVSIPSDHRSGRYVFDNNKSLVTGWIINPAQDDVIFKFSGDTRSLNNENQQAADAVLWNEIRHKIPNEGKNDENVGIPDIVCFEPSGPNYTRSDMDVTHQSTSYSALLKFTEAKNLAILSGKSFQDFVQKTKTVMMHHNKFEFGPDRFNEGLFVMKKLVRYLNLSEEDLRSELVKQKQKLEHEADKEMLKKRTPFTSRPIVATLPRQTSLLVHAKDFVVEEIMEVTEKLADLGNDQIKEYLVDNLVKNTIFPKIGERINNEQIMNLRFNVESVEKYSGKN